MNTTSSRHVMTHANASPSPFCICSRRVRGREQVRVKWSGLEYSDSTWEEVDEVAGDKAGRVSLSTIDWCWRFKVDGRLLLDACLGNFKHRSGSFVS